MGQMQGLHSLFICLILANRKKVVDKSNQVKYT